MKINIHHFHHFDHDEQVPAWARELNFKMGLILRQQEILMSIADDLEAEVAEQSTVITSVETVVQNLVDAIRAAGNDRAKLEAVLTNAQSNKTRLGALAAAGTPANEEAVASPAAPEITA